MKIKPSPQDKRNKIQEIKDWHAILLIIASVMFFFRDILMQKAFMWEDFLYYFYPVRNFAATSIAAGELPFWNPYTFSGMPFQPDIQSALFYIPNLLLTFFVSGERLHFFWVELFIIFHYILAGVGMYFLLREFKLEKFYSLFGSLVFMLSGFMITHGIHQVLINHVAWLPLVFLFFKRALNEKSLLYTILGGLLLGHSILAGFPQVTLYVLLLLLFYFIFEFTIKLKDSEYKESLKIVLPAAGFVIIAIAVTAIQLLPTLELAPLSNRAEITYEKSQEGTLTPQQLITLVVPKFFGEQSAQINNYWGPGGYGQYWETNIYIGIAGLLFALFALKLAGKIKYVLFFGIIMIFAILYTLGDYLYIHKFFFFNIPGFHLFRNPGRMSLWFTFAASILSAFGIKELVNYSTKNPKIIIKIIFAIFASGTIIWAIIQIGILQDGVSAEYTNAVSEIVSKGALVFLILLAAISALLFAFSRSLISASMLIVGILLIQFIDVNLFGFSFNNGPTSPGAYYKQAENLTNYLKTEGQREYFRINSRQGGRMILDRNQGMVDKIFMMEGYTPLSLQRIYPPTESWDKLCDLMNARFRIQVNEETRTLGLSESKTYLPRSFFVYDYQIIKDEEKIKEFMSQPEFNPRDIAVLEEEPGLEIINSDSVDWKSEITSYRLNSITLNVYTPHDGLLVLSEIYYPGWKAFVDNTEQKVYRANWNLRAIYIEKGEHKIDMRFEPDSFRTGAWISISAIGLSFAGIVYSYRKKIKK